MSVGCEECGFGECNETNAVCVCDANWVHDQTLYHSITCTLPELVPVVALACSAVISIYSLGQLVFHFPTAASSNHHASMLVMRLLQFGALTNVFSTLQLSSIVVQSGWFELASIFYLAANLSLVLWIDQVIKLVLFPLHQLERDQFVGSRLHVQVKATLVLVALVIVVSAVAKFVTCHNANIFNLIVDCTLLVRDGLFIVLCAGFTCSSKWLESRLTPVLFARSETDNRGEVIQLMRQMSTTRRRTLGITIAIVCFQLPWIIANQVLGMSPFAWICLYVDVLGQQALTVLFTREGFDWDSAAETAAEASETTKQPELLLRPRNLAMSDVSTVSGIVGGRNPVLLTELSFSTTSYNNNHQ